MNIFVCVECDRGASRATCESDVTGPVKLQTATTGDDDAGSHSGTMFVDYAGAGQLANTMSRKLQNYDTELRGTQSR